MLYENGQVVATEPGQATVAVVRTSACQSCKARHACGQAVLGQATDGSKQEAKNYFLIPYSGKAQEGDWVQLEIEEDRLTLAAFWLYLWPLLIAFLGLLIGSTMALAEPIQLLMAMLGGGMALVFTRQRFKAASSGWVPRIKESGPSVDSAATSSPIPLKI